MRHLRVVPAAPGVLPLPHVAVPRSLRAELVRNEGRCGETIPGRPCERACAPAPLAVGVRLNRVRSCAFWRDPDVARPPAAAEQSVPRLEHRGPGLRPSR